MRHLPLSQKPVKESLHVYLNGVEQYEPQDWALRLDSGAYSVYPRGPMEIETSDLLEARYVVGSAEYLPGVVSSPVPDGPACPASYGTQLSNFYDNTGLTAGRVAHDFSGWRDFYAPIGARGSQAGDTCTASWYYEQLGTSRGYYQGAVVRVWASDQPNNIGCMRVAITSSGTEITSPNLKTRTIPLYSSPVSMAGSLATWEALELVRFVWSLNDPSTDPVERGVLADWY